MLQFFDTLTNLAGQSLFGATVQVLNYPSGTLATIYSSNGTTSPIANSTVSADITGQVSFFAPDGSYQLNYSYQGTQYKQRFPVLLIDPMGFVAASDSGSANAYVVSGTQYPATKYVGLKLEINAANTNTGASTLNYQGDGGIAINQPGGSALSPGMIQANGLIRLEWDGTQWQLLGSQSQPFYARSTAENSAGVVPTNFSYPPGHAWRYGMIGNGVTDNSTAWALWMTYLNFVAFNWFNPGPPLDYLKVNAAVGFLPAGDYVVNTGWVSPGGTSVGVAFQGEGSNVTRIHMGAGVVLISGTSAMFGGVRGITTYGGSGLYNLTGTGSNVEGMFQFEDINAFGYTGCYIGHCFNNAPDWFFRRMILNGAQTAGNERQSFGIVIGGLCDGNHIEDIDFQNNLVNIKFNGGAGGNGANNTLIKNCQFYRWFASPTNLPAYDIWVVPDTSAPSVGNNGVGIKITENKFGNENVLTTDYRILFADENTSVGTNRLNYLPKTTSASTGFVGGMIIKDNIVFGSATGPAVPSRAFVFSQTPNLWQLEIDNKFNGAFLPSLDFYSGSLTNKAANNILNRIRQLHLADASTNTSPISPMPSAGAGSFADEHALYQGFSSIRSFYQSGHDPSYTDLQTTLLTTAGTSPFWGTTTASVAGGITDSVGGNEAVEVTLSADGGGIAQSLTTNPTQDRVGFISFDLKKSTTNPLTRIRVTLTDNTGTFVIVTRSIALPTNWRRVTIPFTVPGNDATISVIGFTDVQGDYAAGTNRFQVGRVRVYHAFEATHPGTRMLDSGLVAWTPGLIAAGASVSNAIAVVGARAGDLVVWGYDNALGGVNPLQGVITANDQVTVYLHNFTAGGITPTAGNARVRVFKAT